ncbi:hypothetical protein ACLOJK_037503, partial [Asimina triloba]
GRFAGVAWTGSTGDERSTPAVSGGQRGEASSVAAVDGGSCRQAQVASMVAVVDGGRHGLSSPMRWVV